MTDYQSRLSEYLKALGPAAVAVSGGVDSMTLAVLAHRMNQQIQMFHAVSPAVPRQATERVKHYATQEGWSLTLIDAGETEDPAYLANPANRCYFCKTNLYSTIVANTQGRVLSGTNIDDLSDYRPGLAAAEEHRVLHPYVDCEISKADLRHIARSLGLTDLHDLPAAPCLSSRIETGIHISPDVLPIINEVELAVRTLRPGDENVRCRIRSNGVAMEIDDALSLSEEELASLRTLVARHFANSKFATVAEQVNITSYRQGSAFLKDTVASLAVDITPKPA